MDIMAALNALQVGATHLVLFSAFLEITLLSTYWMVGKEGRPYKMVAGY